MLKHVFKIYWNFNKTHNNINLNFVRNAGHSKWQNIKHTKAAKDAAKSMIFLRLSRQIRLAIAEGGSSDVKKNLKLENVLDQAKRASMPNSTIQNVIKSCENDTTNAKPHLLELKGAGGCIILCEVLTSNLHSLKQTISTLLRKNHGKYSDGGGIHLFSEKGIVHVELDKSKSVEEALETATDHAILAGAEDVTLLEGEAEEKEEQKLEFLCGATNLRKVVQELEKFNYKIVSATVEYIPLKYQTLEESDLQFCSNLYEKLEALPEVVKISDNIA